MQQHNFKVQRTAKVLTLGQFSQNTKEIWFVLHGYGQLASFFIKKFETIASDEVFIVAPEAISRFYIKPYTRVGASWMTFDERSSEIEEYVAYLNDVYQHFTQNVDVQNIKINILGFSQGCVTACRWLDAGIVRCDRLLFCSGFFSNGLSDVIAIDKLENLETYYIYGDQDEYLVENPEISATFMASMKVDVPHIKIIEFAGGHSVQSSIIEDIAQNKL